MREIVFRGKRTDIGEWAYGSLLLWPDGEATILESKDGHTAVWKREINPDTVGQYTGLKDRDGKEIYEGDLLLFVGMVWEVGCNENLASFVLCTEYVIGSTPLGEMIRSFDFKISGNIHDNPELLEDEEISEIKMR